MKISNIFVFSLFCTYLFSHYYCFYLISSTPTKSSSTTYLTPVSTPISAIIISRFPLRLINCRSEKYCVHNKWNVSRSIISLLLDHRFLSHTHHDWALYPTNWYVMTIFNIDLYWSSWQTVLVKTADHHHATNYRFKDNGDHHNHSSLWQIIIQAIPGIDQNASYGAWRHLESFSGGFWREYVCWDVFSDTW